MNKIYLYCVPLGTGSGIVHGSTVGGDVMGYALAEDGMGLGSHLSSSMYWAQHDIGFNSDWHHDDYKEHYPDGYEVEWIDYEDLDKHEGFQNALKLNHESE